MEQKKQIWILVALAIAVGLVFEVMKENSSRVPHLAKFGKFDELINEGRPVYNPSESFSKKSPEKMSLNKSIRKTMSETRLAGMDPSTANQAQEIAAPKSTPAPALAPKKDEKKKDDKKSKKKKKTIKGAQNNEPAQASTESAETKDDGTDQNFDSGSGLSPLAGAPGFFFGANPKNGIPVTQQEWENYILREPDFEKTTFMIRTYQTGKLSREIFEAVTDEMLSDSRPKMREFGIMSLGATPSVRSFALLVSIRSDEKGNSKFVAQANTYLKMYTNLENLQYLAGAIKLEGNPAANYEALRILKNAANIHLTKSPPSEPTEQGGSDEPREIVNTPILKYFNPFLGLLQSVTQEAKNSVVREQAGETLAQLKELLPPITT